MLASQSMARKDDAVSRALIEAAPDGIILLDAEDHIRIFNPAGERLFGYQAEEVIGKPMTMLLPLLHRAAPPVSREVLARRKDGSTFPAYLSVGRGEMDGAAVTVGIIHDLAARGDAARLDAMRVGAMAQMGAALAHELNQPLAAAMNYVKAAQRTLEPSEDPRAAKAGDLLGKAGEQVARAGNVIRHFRDIVGKRETARREESLQTIIEEATALGLVGAGGSGIEMRIALDPAIPPILVDKVQLQQVITNLIRNAVEAMLDAPDRQLRIEAGISEPGVARVTISDTGHGFLEGIAGRIFQPFATTKEKGMGLGLTISQSIINAHGGRLWATPHEGAGVSFHFQLPLAKTTED